MWVTLVFSVYPYRVMLNPMWGMQLVLCFRFAHTVFLKYGYIRIHISLSFPVSMDIRHMCLSGKYGYDTIKKNVLCLARQVSSDSVPIVASKPSIQQVCCNPFSVSKNIALQERSSCPHWYYVLLMRIYFCALHTAICCTMIVTTI